MIMLSWVKTRSFRCTKIKLLYQPLLVFTVFIPIVQQEELMESHPSGVARNRIRVIGGKFQTVIFFHQRKGNLIRVSEEWGGEVWRHVTMVALFLDDTNPTTKATARTTAKNNMFILTNNNFALALCYFVHFFCRHCSTTTWNFLISRARFIEYVNTTQKLSLSFSKLRWRWMRSQRKFRQDLPS